jgi:hypothetical protein
MRNNALTPNRVPPFSLRTNAHSATAVANASRTRFPVLHRVNGVDNLDGRRDGPGPLTMRRWNVNLARHTRAPTQSQRLESNYYRVSSLGP